MRLHRKLTAAILDASPRSRPVSRSGWQGLQRPTSQRSAPVEHSAHRSKLNRIESIPTLEQNAVANVANVVRLVARGNTLCPAAGVRPAGAGGQRGMEETASRAGEGALPGPRPGSAAQEGR